MTRHQARWPLGLGPAVAAGLWVGACGGGDTQPPASGDIFGSDGAPGFEAGALPEGSAKVDAGAPGSDSGTHEADAADGGPRDATVDVPPAPPVCAQGYAWGSAREWTADAIARFGGPSATGLTLSWTRTGGDIVVVDRLNESSSFFPPVVLPVEALQPFGRLALDPGGVLLVGVAPSGTDFVVLRRDSTNDALWTDAPVPIDGAAGVPFAAPFEAIRTAALQAGAILSEPVLSASGEALFYLQTPAALPISEAGADAESATPDASNDAATGADAGAQTPVPTGPSVLYESRWDANAMQWAAGVPLTATELQSPDTAHRRRPTGASSDDLTLFFFDEVTNVQRAAWRVAVGAPFTHFEDIAIAPEAAPNADCSALYYRGQSVDAGTQGVFAVR